MPQYTYDADPGRVYPSLGLCVDPGDTHDFDAPPDWRWDPPADATAAPTDPAPASDTTDTTSAPDTGADNTDAPAGQDGSN